MNHFAKTIPILLGPSLSLTTILSAAERPASPTDAGVAACSIAPVNPRCEYRRDPLGVDAKYLTIKP